MDEVGSPDIVKIRIVFVAPPMADLCIVDSEFTHVIVDSQSVTGAECQRQTNTEMLAIECQ